MAYTSLPRNCKFRSQPNKRLRFSVAEMQTSKNSEKLQFRNKTATMYKMI
jgi:hypothetical protein